MLHSCTSDAFRDFPPLPTFMYFAKCASDCKASSLSSALLNTTTSVIRALCVDIKLQIKTVLDPETAEERESNNASHLRPNCLFPWTTGRVSRLKQLSPLNFAPCPHVITLPTTPLFAEHYFGKEWISALDKLQWKIPGLTNTCVI